MKCEMCGGDETFGEMTSELTGATGTNASPERHVSYMHRSKHSCSAAKAKRVVDLERRVTDLEQMVTTLATRLGNVEMGRSGLK